MIYIYVAISRRYVCSLLHMWYIADYFPQVLIFLKFTNMLMKTWENSFRLASLVDKQAPQILPESTLSCMHNYVLCMNERHYDDGSCMQLSHM